MNDKALHIDFNMTYSDLEGIFFDEAKRIVPDENEAAKLTSEAVRNFLDHYHGGKLKARPGKW